MLASEKRSEILVEQDELLQKLYLKRAHRDVLSFTLFTKSKYNLNWHHVIICDYLNKFVRKEITRLMIWAPPRYGKTELVSTRLPAFIFGQHPDTHIIATAYSDAVASKNNRSVQRVMQSPEFRKVFPDVKLPQKGLRHKDHADYKRTDSEFETIGHRGVYKSAGILGSLTSFGADYLIIDDPFKNREEADSKQIRDKIWDQWTSTISTRLDEADSAVCIINTRWHEDDLCGRLLAEAKADKTADQWTVVCLPALKENNEEHPLEEDERKVGEVLWPDKHDFDELMKRKKSVGPRDWNALYQQRPSANEGELVKRKHFQFWKQLPADIELLWQSWDTSFKDKPGSSKVVGGVWAKKGASFYLVDLVRDLMGFTATIAAIRAMSAKHPKALTKLIEDKANGPAIIETLKKEIPGLIAVKPEGSKESRLSAVSPYFEAGNVYIPDPSIAPWVKDYIEELVNFPNAADDDQVDMTSQALLWIKLKGAGEFTKDYVNKTGSRNIRREEHD